jgi:hypothetical protein
VANPDMPKKKSAVGPKLKTLSRERTVKKIKYKNKAPLSLGYAVRSMYVKKKNKVCACLRAFRTFAYVFSQSQRRGEE